MAYLEVEAARVRHPAVPRVAGVGELIRGGDEERSLGRDLGSFKQLSSFRCLGKANRLLVITSHAAVVISESSGLQTFTRKGRAQDRDQFVVDVADRLPEETALVNPALAFEASLPPLVKLFTAAAAKTIRRARVVPERPNIGVHVKEQLFSP